MLEKNMNWKKKLKITLDDNDLIDEDSLLEPEDLIKPITSGKCDVKKKACKNCSCGRAEEEIQEEIKVNKEKKSGCGSCGLGDAFRCGGCPYLGLPPFKEGEKIVIDLK